MQSNVVDARSSVARQAASSIRVSRVRTQYIVRCDNAHQSKHHTQRHWPPQQCLQLATGALAVQQIACAQAAHASEAVSGISEATGTLPLALGGGAAIAALSAALLATDPQKRSDSVA